MEAPAASGTEHAPSHIAVSSFRGAVGCIAWFVEGVRIIYFHIHKAEVWEQVT
jgi:hypothetical protein